MDHRLIANNSAVLKKIGELLNFKIFVFYQKDYGIAGSSNVIMINSVESENNSVVAIQQY